MPRQGEVFWVDEGEPVGSEPGYRRPYVVIQNDRWNESPMTVAVTTSDENRQIEQPFSKEKGLSS